MEGKNIRVEKLVNGEIYYEDMGNGNTYISLYKENENHNNIYIQLNRKTFNKTGQGVKLSNVQRVATELEKAWLNYCIEKDKYISYEDFLKKYKPTYEKGKWYKTGKYYAKCVKHTNNKMTCSEMIMSGDFRNVNKTHYTFKSDIPSGYKWELVTDLKEIEPYLPKDHPDKQLDIKQIQEECKKRFPIGCKFKCAGSSIIYTLNEKEDTYEILEENIDAGFGQGFLYYKGKYAELIETPEVIIPEYVEYIDTLYKGTIVKVEDWCCGSYCKVIFYNGNKEQPFKHLVKQSTKAAYDLQNLKQQPLTPEQSYNTKIEVGDEVEVIQPCSSSLNKKGHIGRVEKIFQGRLIDFGSCQVYEINGWCEHISALKLVKKANKTSALDKKVDVISSKVPERLQLKIRETVVENTIEERIKLKLNNLKTIKIKQHVN